MTATLAELTSADWSPALDSPGAPGSGLDHVVEGVYDVAQCIQIIVTTPQGSDYLRPTFGADLFQYLDKPMTIAVPALVREIAEAIERWEPRAKLLQVLAQPLSDQGGAHLEITLVWQLVGVSGPSQRTTVTL